MDTKLSVNHAAQKLDISPQSVKRWINQNKLNGEKFNGKWYVIPDEKYQSHLNTDDIHLDTNMIQLDTNNQSYIQHLESEIGHLRDQLERRDTQTESQAQQIDHLTQVVAMSQKNIGALTEQLSDSRQLIEDMRQRKTVWQRLKAVFVTSTG